MEGLSQKFKNKTYFNLDTTLAIARQMLADRNPHEVCWRASVKYDEGAQEFIVPFLKKNYRVTYPSGEVYHPEEKDVPLDTQILILHYLYHAEGVPLHHKWISFKELPSGQIYITPFHNRAIRPLIKYFGNNTSALIKAGLALGGEKKEFGDASVTIPVFPMVPVTYIVWEGDDEFPPSGNVLFDSSAPHYLPTEDYAVIGSKVVFELKKVAEQLNES